MSESGSSGERISVEVAAKRRAGSQIGARNSDKHRTRWPLQAERVRMERIEGQLVQRVGKDRPTSSSMIAAQSQQARTIAQMNSQSVKKWMKKFARVHTVNRVDRPTNADCREARDGKDNERNETVRMKKPSQTCMQRKSSRDTTK